MKELTLITLGLLVGWLIEWVIDWLYWRRKYRLCQDENTQLRTQIGALQVKIAGEKSRLDDFTLISGIGPVISGKLNDAGINTFEALAATSPKRLRTILGDLIERLADEEDLLKQAKKFAKQKELARKAKRKKKSKKNKKQKENKKQKKNKKQKNNEKLLEEAAALNSNTGKEDLPG